jgi:hypothetical protein
MLNYDFAALPMSVGHELALADIMRYERHLGVQARFTPASTALAVLQQSHADCGSIAYLDPLSRDAINTVPWPINRAPAHANQHVQDGAYVHVFDKKSAYLAAAHALRVGRGDPVHWPNEHSHVPDVLIDESIQKEQPGLWCISAQPPRPVGISEEWPSPFNSHGDLPDHEWYYTPQVKLAMSMGYQVTIHEAWLWPNSHRTLDRWVDRIWKARQATQGTPVEAMIKASYTQALGVLSRKPGEAEKLQWYHRPDWAGLITAQHYLRQVKKIMQLVECGVNYLAVSTDSIAIVSHQIDPTMAMPVGWGGPPGMLGQYRHVTTYRGDQAQKLIGLARDGLSAARLYKQMNAWDGDEDDAI